MDIRFRAEAEPLPRPSRCLEALRGRRAFSFSINSKRWARSRCLEALRGRRAFSFSIDSIRWARCRNPTSFLTYCVITIQ